MKDINFAELKALVERQLKEFDGGIMSPDMVPFVPHRQPAADPPKEKEYTEADELYDLGFEAREATETLVEALDDPSYDDAFEHAFRASACLRRALNSLIDQGAKPLAHKRVVAPKKSLQKYFGKRQGGEYFRPPFSSDAGMVENQNLQEFEKRGEEEATQVTSISLPKRLTSVGGISDAADYITTISNELLRIKNNPEQLERISVFDSKFLYLMNQLINLMVLADGVDLEGKQLEIERAIEDFKRDLDGVIGVKYT
jgi:hypothetical protein